jgi:uncharacterized membrane protein
MTRAAHPPANSLVRQRGAIGILGTVTLMLAVLFTALVVDSGRLWMQKRHLQTVADIASIQAARSIGCGVSLSNVTQAAQSAAAANGYTGNLANSPNLVELVDVTTNASGIRQYSAGGSEAVRVYATRVVPASLVVGGLFGNTVTLNAEAVSRADPAIAAFSAGSFAASIDTEDSVLLNGLLGGMLGSSLDLDLVSYQGIAAADITLNDLLEASGQVGGLDSLLNSQMSVGDLASLAATAMSNSGTASASAIAGMQEIASAGMGSADVTLSDVLNVTTPDREAAGRVGVNALSLITTTAMIANGNNAISMPLSISGIPLIPSITAQVNIIEPPQIAIGPPGSNGVMCTTLSTAQVQARVDVVGPALLLASINLSLRVQVAQGSASLASVVPGNGSTDVTISATPGIASMSMTNAAGSGPARIFLTLTNTTLATLALDVPVQSASAQSLVFNVAHPAKDNLPQTQTVSSPVGDSLEDALEDAGAVDVTVLSILNLGLINSVVSSVVSPLLGEIGRVFLDPLLELLGIKVGGMDVTLEGVQMRQEDPLII